MIVTLKNTTTTEVGSRLLSLREEGGVVALGRVLTLIIVASGGEVEAAIQAANDASREHPCRVILVNRVGQQSGNDDGTVDAEIRVGADAGASEVVLLSPHGAASRDVDTLITPLLLPDAPIVVWWPQRPPHDLASSLLGTLSQRRISDVAHCEEPIKQLHILASSYTPGDTDLSWAKTTLWRGLATTAWDISPQPVQEGRVYGDANHPGVRLFAAWLAHSLDVPVRVKNRPNTHTFAGFTLRQDQGSIRMERLEGSTAVKISITSQPDQQLSLPVRTVSECLIEDLRRLDPDTTYAAALAALSRIEVR